MVNEKKDAVLEGIKEAFQKKDELKAIIHNRMVGVVEERRLILIEYLSNLFQSK
jgi:hypothetical protein